MSGPRITSANEKMETEGQKSRIREGKGVGVREPILLIHADVKAKKSTACGRLESENEEEL